MLGAHNPRKEVEATGGTNMLTLVGESTQAPSDRMIDDKIYIYKNDLY